MMDREDRPNEHPEHNNGELHLARAQMLALLRRSGILERVIAAMSRVRRERFVPEPLRRYAYEDRPLPIGAGQTISQPLIVAMMCDALELKPDDRVLEVGTGSGYEAAVLARLAREVITVERQPALVEGAIRALLAEGCTNVSTFAAGPGLGRPQDAPYDAIVVAAGAPHLPRALIDQLAPGGRLVVPVGTLREQQLVRARTTPYGLTLERLGPCAFVPLIGTEAWPDDAGTDASRRIKVR